VVFEHEGAIYSGGIVTRSKAGPAVDDAKRGVITRWGDAAVPDVAYVPGGLSGLDYSGWGTTFDTILAWDFKTSAAAGFTAVEGVAEDSIRRSVQTDRVLYLAVGAFTLIEEDGGFSYADRPGAHRVVAWDTVSRAVVGSWPVPNAWPIPELPMLGVSPQGVVWGVLADGTVGVIDPATGWRTVSTYPDSATRELLGWSWTTEAVWFVAFDRRGGWHYLVRLRVGA
jgi:hypothetical protein